jgi:hypothetical protein
MKLKVDLTALWSRVHEMGAEQTDFKLNRIIHDEITIDDELERGKEVTLDELEVNNGLLSVQGRQVLLYIPDQGQKINEVLEQPSVGKKFHVADCKTLHDMKAKQRFERYKVTNNLKRSFEVYGVHPFTKQEISGDAELAVCRNCLTLLNYQNYRNSAKAGRDSLVTAFKFDEFFSTYNSVFSRLPKSNIFHTGSGYTTDWDKVSSNYRQSKNFKCEECGVDLASDQKLLHTHHINGNKKDNRDSNLSALCVDCHKKQPLHEHMFVPYKDILQINQLRKQQGLIIINSWNDVYRLADTSLSGLIKLLEKHRVELPVMNYHLSKSNDQVNCNLDLAWPASKTGLVITAANYHKAKQSNWQIYMPDEMLRFYR